MKIEKLIITGLWRKSIMVLVRVMSKKILKYNYSRSFKEEKSEGESGKDHREEMEDNFSYILKVKSSKLIN